MFRKPVAFAVWSLGFQRATPSSPNLPTTEEYLTPVVICDRRLTVTEAHLAHLIIDRDEVGLYTWKDPWDNRRCKRWASVEEARARAGAHADVIAGRCTWDSIVLED